MATIIKGHNAKVSNPTAPENNPNPPEKTCNCRKKENCPLRGNCLQNNVIYQATVTTANQKATYFGSCSTSFEARYNNHTASYRHQEKVSNSKLL